MSSNNVELSHAKRGTDMCLSVCVYNTCVACTLRYLSLSLSMCVCVYDVCGVQKEQNTVYSDEDVIFFERQLDLYGRLCYVS